MQISNYDHYIVIVVIMFAAGLLGGYGNYLVLTLPAKNAGTEDDKQSKFLTDKYLLLRSIILGLIASFLVPLFLKTISSNLLNKPVATGSNDGYIFNAIYLVLIGFCLLAAVLSKQFIEGLYEKVMKAQADATKAVNKAEEANKKVKNMEASLTEKDEETDPDDGPGLSAAIVRQPPTLEESVMAAITDSKYIWRSASGIAKNLGTKKNEIAPILQKLLADGKLDRKVNADNQFRYKIRV